MAMVKLGAGLTDINGGQGGVVWRWDHCRQHVQAKPRKRWHDPAKPYPQQKAFSRCIRYLQTEPLSKEERDRWWKYCYDHPKKNKKGETYYFHPVLAFLSVNIRRILRGQDIIPIPLGY